jgi:hypothetical protein
MTLLQLHGLSNRSYSALSAGLGEIENVGSALLIYVLQKTTRSPPLDAERNDDGAGTAKHDFQSQMSTERAQATSALQSMADKEERRTQLKLSIANAATKLLEAPEEHVPKLKELLPLCADKVCVCVCVCVRGVVICDRSEAGRCHAATDTIAGTVALCGERRGRYRGAAQPLA